MKKLILIALLIVGCDTSTEPAGYVVTSSSIPEGGTVLRNSGLIIQFNSYLPESFFEADTIIKEIIDTDNTYCILDPCSGNSFHTFLFNEFCNKKVMTIDIQPEENAWIDTIEYDGLKYLKEMENHSNIILLLSWVDYDDLSLQLLKTLKKSKKRMVN